MEPLPQNPGCGDSGEKSRETFQRFGIEIIRLFEAMETLYQQVKN